MGKTDDLYLLLDHASSSQKPTLILITPQLLHEFTKNLKRYPPDFEKTVREILRVVVLDEVHYTFWGPKISKSILSILNYENVNFVLGLSATPTKDAKDVLKNVFRSFTTEKAMKKGILIRGLKIYSTSTRIDLETLKKLIESKLNLDDLEDRAWQVAIAERAKKYSEKIIEVLKKEVGDDSLKYRIPKTLVVAANTREAEEIQKNLVELVKQYHKQPDDIISVAHYKTSSPENVIFDFVKKKEGILVTVNMADLGFDDRNLETLVIARPVRSLLSYIQIRGRVLRRPDDCADKNNVKLTKRYAVLVDFTEAANYEEKAKQFEENALDVAEGSEKVQSDLRGYDSSGTEVLKGVKIEVGEFKTLKLGTFEGNSSANEAELLKQSSNINPPTLEKIVVKVNGSQGETDEVHCKINELKQVISQKMQESVSLYITCPVIEKDEVERVIKEIKKTYNNLYYYSFNPKSKKSVQIYKLHF
ncbi:MAG: DEAD/DEAH box helicase [Thermoproteota archaeon]